MKKYILILFIVLTRFLSYSQDNVTTAISTPWKLGIRGGTYVNFIDLLSYNGYISWGNQKHEFSIGPTINRGPTNKLVQGTDKTSLYKIRGIHFNYRYFPFKLNRLFRPFTQIDLMFKRASIVGYWNRYDWFGNFIDSVEFQKTQQTFQAVLSIGCDINLYKGLYFTSSVGSGLAILDEDLNYKSTPEYDGRAQSYFLSINAKAGLGFRL
jgi:hypothetical protein